MLIEVFLVGIFVIGCAAIAVGLRASIMSKRRVRDLDVANQDEVADGPEERPKLHGGPGGFIGSQY